MGLLTKKVLEHFRKMVFLCVLKKEKKGGPTASTGGRIHSADMVSKRRESINGRERGKQVAIGGRMRMGSKRGFRTKEGKVHPRQAFA